MDTISEARLAQVHPALAARIYRMANLLAPQTFRVAQGLRTFAEQAALYAQGRTAPGNIVTDADAGYSMHNYGFAVDCYPNNPDGTIDWGPSHPDWKAMEQCGVSVGLVSGANFIRLVDAPHFELSGRFPSSTTDEMRSLFASGGLQAVWDAAGIPAVQTIPPPDPELGTS